MRYYEDYEVGERVESEGRTVTEGDIERFVQNIGMYAPMFVDMEFVREFTPFDRRYAPGEMVASLTFGNAIRTGFFESALAMLGFSVDFPNPVLAGDTITVEFEVLDKRETSDPERGIVTYGYTTSNQDGDVVAEVEEKVLTQRRPTE